MAIYILYDGVHQWCAVVPLYHSSDNFFLSPIIAKWYATLSITTEMHSSSIESAEGKGTISCTCYTIIKQLLNRRWYYCLRMRCIGNKRSSLLLLHSDTAYLDIIISPLLLIFLINSRVVVAVLLVVACCMMCCMHIAHHHVARIAVHIPQLANPALFSCMSV